MTKYVIRVGKDKFVRAHNVPSLVERERATVFADREVVVGSETLAPIDGRAAAESCLASLHHFKFRGAEIVRA